MCQNETSVGRREIAPSDDSDGPPKGKIALLLSLTRLKVPPMRITCVAALIASLALLSVGFQSVYADQVDDLLAGKPVQAVAQEPATNPAATDPTVVGHEDALNPTEQSVPRGSLSEPSWELTLAAPDRAGEVSISSQAGDEANRPPAAPAGAISLVPEPSAIALAAAALVYFLIFFRRRYSF